MVLAIPDCLLPTAYCRQPTAYPLLPTAKIKIYPRPKNLPHTAPRPRALDEVATNGRCGGAGWWGVVSARPEVPAGRPPRHGFGPASAAGSLNPNPPRT